ncbi:peptide ABC transporter substrate-binding protein [Paenibacillus hamazuiensis]|uniref:peptide ABC transporter substrate-binding protein n=1 Tax=Paenibacillus hamazuiensis TaxID=2936508 RepID=UPI00200E1746|nr:peptide ABC transporter substrate-binding protein [Paenibacillus hamazuiensis]
MKFRQLVLLGTIIGLFGSVLPGCSVRPPQNDTDDKIKLPAQELTIAMYAEPPALDSSTATASPAITILNAIGEGLYRLNKDGKPEPGLAKELPHISADGLVYTIPLREGLMWADGSPLKAGDFEFAYKRTLDPATKAKLAPMLVWIKGGSELMKAKPEELEAKKAALGVKAKDDKTLEITLEKPVAFFTDQLSMPIFFPQKPDFVKAQGDKYGSEAGAVLGAGPFKLEQWDHHQLMLVKNDKYWDAKNVKLGKVSVRIVKDAGEGLKLYGEDQIGLAELKGEQIAAYKGRQDVAVKREFVTAYILINQNPLYAPFLQNAKIRRALAASIDTKQLADGLMGGVSVPAAGLVPLGIADGAGQEFRKTAGETMSGFDPDKAKQLLAEGLAEIGLTELPKFKLSADDTEIAKKTVEFILAQWKTNLGIEVEGDPMPYAQRAQKMQDAKDFQALIALWGADYNDPMTFLDPWLTDNKSFNYITYRSKPFDDLVKAADKEADTARRARLLVDAEKRLMEDMPLIPLYFRARPFAKKTNVEGLVLPAIAKEWELKWTYIK